MPSGSLKLRGRVRAVLGDNIDTDIIYPGRYLNITDREKTAEHLFELAYPEIRTQLQPGEFIVAGKNFGCGSSREQAPVALKEAGVGAVVAGSFARIFYRNAINIGLPVIECPEAFELFKTGDVALINVDKGILVNETTGKSLRFKPMPEFLRDIMNNGGLVRYTKEKLRR